VDLVEVRSTDKELPAAKRQRKNGDARSGDEGKGAIRRDEALQSVVELIAESKQFVRRFKKRARSTGSGQARSASSGQAFFEQVNRLRRLWRLVRYDILRPGIVG
jgi:hypothetical protein